MNLENNFFKSPLEQNIFIPIELEQNPAPSPQNSSNSGRLYTYNDDQEQPVQESAIQEKVDPAKHKKTPTWKIIGAAFLALGGLACLTFAAARAFRKNNNATEPFHKETKPQENNETKPQETQTYDFLKNETTPWDGKIITSHHIHHTGNGKITCPGPQEDPFLKAESPPEFPPSFIDYGEIDSFQNPLNFKKEIRSFPPYEIPAGNYSLGNIIKGTFIAAIPVFLAYLGFSQTNRNLTPLNPINPSNNTSLTQKTGVSASQKKSVLPDPRNLWQLKKFNVLLNNFTTDFEPLYPSEEKSSNPLEKRKNFDITLSQKKIDQFVIKLIEFIPLLKSNKTLFEQFEKVFIEKLDYAEKKGVDLMQFEKPLKKVLVLFQCLEEHHQIPQISSEELVQSLTEMPQPRALLGPSSLLQPLDSLESSPLKMMAEPVFTPYHKADPIPRFISEKPEKDEETETPLEEGKENLSKTESVLHRFSITPEEELTFKKDWEKHFCETTTQNNDSVKEGASTLSAFDRLSKHISDKYKFSMQDYRSIEEFQNAHNSTPFHFAVIHGDDTLAKLLIEAGANIAQKDQNENNALIRAALELHEADKGNRKAGKSCAKILELIQLFLDNGLSLHDIGENGDSPMKILSAKYPTGNQNIDALLLKTLDDVNEENVASAVNLLIRMNAKEFSFHLDMLPLSQIGNQALSCASNLLSEPSLFDMRRIQIYKNTVFLIHHCLNRGCSLAEKNSNGVSTLETLSTKFPFVWPFQGNRQKTIVEIEETLIKSLKEVPEEHQKIANNILNRTNRLESIQLLEAQGLNLSEFGYSALLNACKLYKDKVEQEYEKDFNQNALNIIQFFINKDVAKGKGFEHLNILSKKFPTINSKFNNFLIESIIAAIPPVTQDDGVLNRQNPSPGGCSDIQLNDSDKDEQKIEKESTDNIVTNELKSNIYIKKEIAATKKFNEEIKEILTNILFGTKNYTVIDKLVDKGLDINAKNSKGRTVLDEAVSEIYLNGGNDILLKQLIISLFTKSKMDPKEKCKKNLLLLAEKKLNYLEKLEKQTEYEYKEEIKFIKGLIQEIEKLRSRHADNILEASEELKQPLLALKKERTESSNNKAANNSLSSQKLNNRHELENAISSNNPDKNLLILKTLVHLISQNEAIKEFYIICKKNNHNRACHIAVEILESKKTETLANEFESLIKKKETRKLAWEYATLMVQLPYEFPSSLNKIITVLTNNVVNEKNETNIFELELKKIEKYLKAQPLMAQDFFQACLENKNPECKNLIRIYAKAVLTNCDLSNRKILAPLFISGFERFKGEDITLALECAQCCTKLKDEKSLRVIEEADKLKTLPIEDKTSADQPIMSYKQEENK